MPRQGRLHIPGGCYHVMGRGLERRRIFAGIEDKRDFLERLGEGLEHTQSQCLAWVVMSNHYHLLIRVSSAPLSTLMRTLLSGYATQYNLRHRRAGYVFQNRFKSILCNEDEYLLELVRYIHLNPLRADIVRTVSELDRYHWSGHAGLMGNHVQAWHERDEVLALFGRQVKRARTKYRQFIRDGVTDKGNTDYLGGGLVRSAGGWESVKALRKEHEMRIGDERILGDSRFVENALKQDQLNVDEKFLWQQAGWNLEKLIDAVCQYMAVKPTDLLSKGRKNNLSIAKSLISYWGTQVIGLSSTEIAIHLAVSQPAISKASKRGGEYCEAHNLEWKTVAKGRRDR